VHHGAVKDQRHREPGSRDVTKLSPVWGQFAPATGSITLAGDIALAAIAATDLETVKLRGVRPRQRPPWLAFERGADYCRVE
jgi:hypothetical protein